MRPLELTLQGFRSHEELTEISFEGRSLIAIVGPTGAGKSSILDGISYALYSKTPREQRSTKKLICSRSEEARVRLRFAVDGRGYEVTRALRRKSGASPHVLVDLDAGEQMCNGEAAVTARIEELLGLDFAAFCSSVLLAQGDFAKFLGATPAKRGEILKGVFRLEQIDALRDAAKRRVDELGGDLREIEGERRSIPDDIGGLIAAETTRHEVATARAARLEVALPREAELENARRGAHGRSEAATEDLARLEKAATRVPAARTFEELREQEDAIATLLADGRAALEGAEASRGQAVSALGSLEVRYGSERTLVELRGTAEELNRLVAEGDGLGDRIKAQTEELESRREAAGAVRLAHDEALAALERAESLRAEVELAHRAHALRADLKVGEACPVCEQRVSSLPAGEVSGSVTEAKAAERHAKQATKESAQKLTEAHDVVARAESGLQHLTEQRTAVRARSERSRAALDEALGETDDPVGAIDGRLVALVGARAAVDETRDAVDAAAAEIRGHEALEQEFSSARRALAGNLIGVCATFELAPPAVDDNVEALTQSAESASSELSVRTTAARAALKEAETAERDARAQLAELRAGLELEDDASIEKAMARAVSDADVAAERIDALEAKAARAAELDALEASLLARQADFQQLTKDLGPRGFISFLLEGKTRLLLELASERLRAMTDRYRLEIDDKASLNVIDELDGEKRRPVDTLSGGETFLASLALALALAELVGRSGGRLQAFFLDEGFGSLDPEAFDLAMDGIERIVTEDRLIGLVSHVAALAARVEDRIELTKRSDGMSLVHSGGRLG